MDLSMEWPSMVISLESLRPLSPDNFDDEQIATDVDKLSRSELAGKLLDHFDGIHQEESDPFGWYTDERSVDIPIFESLPSPPYKIDLKPPSQANIYLTPTTINAGYYQQEPAQQSTIYHSSVPLATDTFDPLPSLYSPLSAPQHLESPSAVVPMAQPSPPSANPTTTAASYDFSDVKIEYKLIATSSAPAPARSKDEWLKRETLTPPDSPKEEEILKMLEDIEPEELEHLVMAGTDQFESLVIPPSFASKLEPCTSPAAYSDDSASSRSITASPFDGSDDPEWIPSARQSSKVSGRRCNTNKNSVSTKGASTTVAKRRSTKSFSKGGVEERRQRKKEQNKNAATRYRLKKKAEVQEVKLEEHQLEENNAKLLKQVEELDREIRYLKSLMREVYRKKGLIK